MKKKLKNFGIGIIIFFALFISANIFWKYELKQRESINVLDKNGIVLYQTKTQNSRLSSYGDIKDVPDFIKSIVIFREDRRFYSHFGIDFFGVFRAFYHGIKNQKFNEGASTIDQQDIKLGEKAFKRTISQKAKEMVLSVNLDFHYSKDEILLYYINNLPFGNGIYGFKTACNAYFAKDCENLSDGELIYIFMFTKYGKKIDVSQQSYDFSQKLGLDDYTLDDFKKIKSSLKRNISNKAPFYIDYLLDSQNLDSAEGNVLHTTFDYSLYQQIDSEIKNLKKFFLTRNAQDLCAIVIDRDGNVLSMNQMKDFGDEDGGFINYCLMKRQVGSSIKPFLYTLAFHNKIYKPTDYIVDGVVSYDLGDGTKYQPQNFDRGFHGKVSIAQALGNSLNVPAVKVLNSVGLPYFWNFLKEIGEFVGTNEKRNEDYNSYGLSLALGTKEISPLDFAKMRTIFIENDNSPFIQKYAESINQTKSILSDNANRLISFGVDNWLNIPGTFAKTGTSRNLIDGRTCGGTSDKIICVWVGNYNNREMQDSGINTAGIMRNHIVQILQK